MREKRNRILLLMAVMLTLLVPAQALEAENPAETQDELQMADEQTSEEEWEETEEQQPQEEALPETISPEYELTYGEVSQWNGLAEAFEAAFAGQEVTVTYEADEESVLTVDSETGLITVKAGGTAEVTATVTDGEQIRLYTVQVTVHKAEQKITGLGSDQSLRYTGASHNWVEKVSCTGGKLRFASSDPTVAAVDEKTGVVTETGVGTAVITVTAVETDCYAESSQQFTVTIAKGTQTITGRNAKYTLRLSGGKTYDWSNMSSSSGEALQFSSSAPDIVSVDSNGLVTQWDLGTAVITVTAPETELYETAQFRSVITVIKGKQTITGINSGYRLAYSYGKTYDWGKMMTLTGDGTVTYTSSNPKVAAVSSNGVITQKGRGTTVITITVSGTERYEKLVFKSTITIKNKQTISGISASYNAAYLTDRTFDWGAKAKASGGGRLTFTSSNPDVATIDSKTGKLVFKNVGTTTITIRAAETANYAAATFQSKVTVRQGRQTISGIRNVYRVAYSKGKVYNWEPLAKTSGDGTLSFTSDNPEVISIDPGTGKLVQTGKGKATIRITASGTERFQTAAYTSVVYVGQEAATLTGINSKYSVACVVGRTFDWGAKLQYNGNGTVTYTSSDPSVMAVDKNTGLLTVKGSGIAKITITASETAQYRSASLSSTVTVRPNVTQYNFSNSYKSGDYYDKLMAVTLSASQRSDIQKVAKSQVGYHEGGSLNNLSGNSTGEGNYTEYGRWYYNYVSSGDYYYRGAWCCMFVSWCANEAGIPSDVIPRRALVEYMDDAFRSQGCYYTLRQTKVGGGSKAIQAGDLVFYSGTAIGRLSHIGIVTGVSYNGSKVTVTTVEGNYLDKCCTRSWSFTTSSSGRVSNGTYVRGFACPKYTG